MPTILRALFLYLAFAIPTSLVLACVAGPVGAIIGLCLTFMALLGLLLTAEDSISYQFDAEIAVPDGLRRTFEYSVARVDPYLDCIPELRIYSDPRPQALYARGLIGNGSIYLSRGLLAELSEAEIRDIVVEAYRRITRPGARLATLCAVLSLWLSRAFPADAQRLTPIQALGLWILWPWSQAIHFFSGKSGTPGVSNLCRAAINPWFRLPGDISL